MYVITQYLVSDDDDDDDVLTSSESREKDIPTLFQLSYCIRKFNDSWRRFWVIFSPKFLFCE